MAKNSRSSSTGRLVSKATASKSTPSTSVASKALEEGASQSITRSERTGRSIRTTAPAASASDSTRTSRAPLTTVTEDPTTPVRTRSAVSGRPVKVKQPPIRPVRVTPLGPVDRAEIHLLDELVTDAEEISVVGKDNRRVPVAGALLKALATVIGALERGATVTVTDADELDTELTSQEAADLLNVSRPYVVKLAREGVMPHHRVGNRHRFTLVDVLEHRALMRSATEKALAELTPGHGYTAADF